VWTAYLQQDTFAHAPGFLRELKQLKELSLALHVTAAVTSDPGQHEEEQTLVKNSKQVQAQQQQPLSFRELTQITALRVDITPQYSTCHGWQMQRQQQRELRP
jgi:hypothetical protein